VNLNQNIMSDLFIWFKFRKNFFSVLGRITKYSSGVVERKVLRTINGSVKVISVCRRYNSITGRIHWSQD
jgi:hypothetical protein